MSFICGLSTPVSYVLKWTTDSVHSKLCPAGGHKLSVSALLTFVLQHDSVMVNQATSRRNSNSPLQTVDTVIYMMTVALLSLFQKGQEKKVQRKLLLVCCVTTLHVI